jgi:hypothetical protein
MKRASEDVIEAAIKLPDGCVFTAADAGYPDATCEHSELGFSRPDGTGFELPGGTLMIQGLE